MVNPTVPSDFLDLFVSTWAQGREYPTETVHGFPAAKRTDTTKDWEYFAHDPTPETFAALAQKVGGTRLLTIITNETEKYRGLAQSAGIEVLHGNEAMMVTDMSVRDESEIPPASTDGSLVSELLDRGSHILVRVRSKEGALAASGRVVVKGDTVVFDRIVTEPDFRRRGLGRFIMRTLAEEAWKMGKPLKMGVLLGSADGQKLYNALGWREVYRVLIMGIKEENEAAMGRVANMKAE